VIGWRTGCGIIYNATSVHFNVFDPSTRDGRGVDPGKDATFECSPIFWECHDVDRIQQSAFRFRSVQPNGTSQDQFYIFMDRNGFIKWTPMAAPSYDSRQPVPGVIPHPSGEGLVGCIHVTINERVSTDPTTGTQTKTFSPSGVRVW
jgi:hypothetical protein